MSESLRVGVVGAGLIAGCHVRAYATVPGVEVVAVADTRLAKAEQLAAPVGAQARASLEEVLALDTDVISVCTPPSSHAELTVRALEAVSMCCARSLSRAPSGMRSGSSRPQRPATAW